MPRLNYLLKMRLQYKTHVIRYWEDMAKDIKSDFSANRGRNKRLHNDLRGTYTTISVFKPKIKLKGKKNPTKRKCIITVRAINIKFSFGSVQSPKSITYNHIDTLQQPPYGKLTKPMQQRALQTQLLIIFSWFTSRVLEFCNSL
jgi:hypothetical protein